MTFVFVIIMQAYVTFVPLKTVTIPFCKQNYLVRGEYKSFLKFISFIYTGSIFGTGRR